MNLPSNLFDNYTPPQVFLCQPDKTIIGELLPYDFSSVFKFNTYSETTFTISKTYIDLIEGKSYLHPYYYYIDALRVIYIRGMGHFVIQDVKENIADADTKTITAFSLEYSTSTKYLNDFRINTGEDDSLEYVYHIQQYGVEYSIDKPYKKVEKLASNFDPYERYYYQEPTETSYIYTEVQIIDADAFEKYEFDLYVKAYPNIRFYWPSNPNLSLLHIIFSHIPEWKIGHVDQGLWYQERTFSEERISVYDFLYNTAADTFKYVMEWDSINGVVNFYMTEEDGITADNSVQTLWDSDVYISHENLASSIDVSYSTDDIRTKLKVIGGDGLEIRDVNLGQNHITNLSFYNDPMWLGYDLSNKYKKYAEELEGYTGQYADLMSAWASAYHEYDELMNHVPVDVNVLRVGDTFNELYCVYIPVYAEDASQSEIDDAILLARDRLTNKLKTFKVYEDEYDGQYKTMRGSKTDNVLLTLENANSDSATIRIYYDSSDKGEEFDKYKISRTLTNATSGAVAVNNYSLQQWVSGQLNAHAMKLEGFTVKSIGTLGAYLCTVKDETKKENVEDYGIKLLQEKQAVYTKIFITQTEGYMSKEDYQCLASDEQPIGVIAEGTRWLDTDSAEAKIYIYKSGKWVDYAAGDHKGDFENYARFHENYQKLQAVQNVLAEKEKQATYLLNGFAVQGLYIAPEDIKFNSLISAAITYFLAYDYTYIGDTTPTGDIKEGDKWLNTKDDTAEMYVYKNGKWTIYTDYQNAIMVTKYNSEFGIVTFTIKNDTTNEYAVYISDGTPYIAYSRSQGVCLKQMSKLSEMSAIDGYFTEEELAKLSPFMREDEYSDSNFILTGYESEEEQMMIKRSLLVEAEKELKKISQPKLSFDISMANIMAIPEFACLKDKFRLGNFVRVKIRDGYVKRARLLEVSINFEDIADFSCRFGDLVSTKDEISKTADLLQQAVTAGKTVASSSSSWQKGADKATKLDKAIAEGLKDAALAVSASSGQSILWNEKGILGRKLIEGTEDTYYDEQFMLTNNKLVFTTDNWQTSQGVFGTFTVDGQTYHGVLAQALLGGYVEGATLRGGNLNIGDGNFVVEEDGTVTMKNANIQNYVDSSEFADVTGKMMYRTEVMSEGTTVFSAKNQTTKLSCIVYSWDQDITSETPASSFTWIRSSDNATDDIIWNDRHKGMKSITITHDDIQDNATFRCEVKIDN